MKQHLPAARHSAFHWRTGELSIFARGLQRQATQKRDSARRVVEARAQGKNLGTIHGVSRKSDRQREGRS